MKRRWLGVAALVAGACAISVVGARRIEAQYSSPVKVVNSTSAPALNRSVDNHGRISYWAEVTGNEPATVCSGALCVFTFGPVPSGHRLVIEHVMGQLPPTGAVTDVVVELIDPAPVGYLDTYAIFDAPSTTGYFDMPTLAFIDSQRSVKVEAQMNGGGTIFKSLAKIILTGYLLDCTAAPCAAIAH